MQSLTQKEITEGEELIAKFENLIYYEKKFETTGTTVRQWHDKDGLTAYCDDYKNEYYTIPYHDSYDMLMKVINKLEELGYKFKIEDNSCYIHANNYYKTYFIADTKKEAIFKAIVSGIKHHTYVPCKTEMPALSEGQFHTVWTAAVGEAGYDKRLFQRVFEKLLEAKKITQ